jgi:hypothetical protein
MTSSTRVLEAQLLGEGDWIAVTEICRLYRIDAGALRELAELGVVTVREGTGGEWEFAAAALPRLRVMSRLMHDLGVNVSGAALAVELLESQHALERRIRALERLLHEPP